MGSMLRIINQNHLMVQHKEETKNLSLTVKHLEENLLETKVKVHNLEYEMNDMNGFSTSDTIVIRNLDVPEDGNEKAAVEKVLEDFQIEGFEPKEDLLQVVLEQKNTVSTLGSVLVKLTKKDFKKKIMKLKNNMIHKSLNPSIKKLKIMNYKAPETIVFENALRSVLALVPDGNSYKLNGNLNLDQRTS